MTRRIHWRRLDTPGHEVCELTRTSHGWLLTGRADFVHEGDSTGLSYEIRCNADWLTETAIVYGSVGERVIDIELLRNEAGEWALNGSKVWEVTGCDDIDLNFSPSTNTLPIRRLNLSTGESAVVRAAWLRFPSFKLEPFEQTYSRLSRDHYQYESTGGTFRRELVVDEDGLVRDYPGLWKSERDDSAG